MSILLLILGALVALAATVSFFPIRKDPFTGTSFAIGWLMSELAGQLFVLNALLAGLLLWGGGGRSTLGRIGLVLDVLGALGLIALAVVGRASRGVVTRSLGATPGFPVDPTEALRHPRWGRWWRVAMAIPLPGRRIEQHKNIPYVDDGLSAHRLDLYRPAGGVEGAPVMIYVHGGAWIIGDKREQGKPMMFELVRRGWVCVSVNYRLSPKATWPDHIVDVFQAIAWVKEHIAEYGGDPSFVALSGGSAGGHLAALAALSAGDPTFQPGFEDKDTTVDACIPIYGVLEMTGDPATSGVHGPGLKILLERQVMKRSIADHREVFEAASPLHRVHAAAPPFLVLAGTNDTLVPIAVPRAFVPALRAISSQPVGYIELPLAQHAFDVMASPRCSATTAGIVAFLDAVRSARSGGGDS